MSTSPAAGANVPRLFWLLCLLPLMAAHAEIYSYTDASGKRVFTDQPPPGHRPAQIIEVEPTNSMEPALVTRKLRPPQALRERLEQPATLSYNRLDIVSPQADETLRNSRSLAIHIASEPPLQTSHNHSYQLLYDGQPHGQPFAGQSFALDDIDRGSHQLQVRIVDERGRSLKQSPVISFHARQTTLADKRHANPCQKDDYGVRPECPLKDKPEDPKKPWWRFGL